MYKLTVVAGPNRGSTYAVQDGELSIGRQTGNGIVLSSSKVSKRHCQLVVNNDEVVIKDLGSSNGTFVNGVLTKLRKLKAGDRLSVGEFVLELTKPQARAPRAAPAVSGFGNVVQFPTGNQISSPAMPGMPDSSMPGSSGGANLASPMPTDIKGKLLWNFEKHVMPIFYGMALKNEWRMIGVGLFAAFVIGTVIVSVYPLLQSNRVTVIKETGRRAQFMAKQIVEKNSAFIAARAETKTEIGSIEREEGVRVAVLTDLDNRILAPPGKLNQYLASGGEAALAVRARDLFRQGREVGIIKEVDEETIVAIEPMKVLDPQMGRNVVVGMAIVSLDTSLATPDLGEIGMAYSEALIVTGLLGFLIVLVLYRLTIKPFEVLNDDIDKVLKGDIPQVTHEFKFEELDQLYDVINAALQRVPKGGAPGESAAGDSPSGPTVDEYAGPVRMLAGLVKFGLVILDSDRKIVFLNSMFEEISGIRSDNAIGQDIPAVARDQAFGAFSADLFDRATAGTEGISEDFDFSGVTFKMYGAAFGVPGATARCYVLCALRSEG